MSVVFVYKRALTSRVRGTRDFSRKGEKDGRHTVVKYGFSFSEFNGVQTFEEYACIL